MNKYLDIPKNTQFFSVFGQTLPHVIDHASWAAFPYQPSVQFNIAHSGNGIWLQYRVDEKTIKASTIEHNGQVWKDSCVEFFVSPANDGIYYNFEFNCIGAIRLSAGPSRHGRNMAPLSIIEQIQAATTLEKKLIPEHSPNQPWEISVFIPVTCFFEHHIEDLSGLECTANFYKCGDDLSTPHYLSWNPIDTPAPDFHTPGYFGKIYFSV